MTTSSSFFQIIISLVLLLFFSFVSIEGFGQKIKEVKIKHEWPEGLEEIFHVLKKEKTVRHGGYMRVIKNNEEVKGQYDHNERVGIWEFYDNKGNLTQKYNYSDKELLFNSGVIREIRLNSKVDVVPVYIGGVTEYYHVARGMRYPFAATKNGIQGRVVIAFNINERGEMENVHVKHGIGGGCDEEAIRITNALINGWIPAKKEGEVVPVELEIAYHFKLNKRKS